MWWQSANLQSFQVIEVETNILLVLAVPRVLLEQVDSVHAVPVPESVPIRDHRVQLDADVVHLSEYGTCKKVCVGNDM
jgi:hypothetical protein